MRKRGLLLCFLVAGAALAVEATIPSAQDLARIPTRLSAFLPRSPLPDSKTMAPDAVAFLGLVMEGAKTTNFAARYCPVMESVIAVAPQTIPELSTVPRGVRARATDRRNGSCACPG